MWNIAGMGLPLVAAALFIPHTLNGLGKEAFGIVALIWTLIGYFGLFDLGVGRALTVIVGRQHTHSQNGAVQHALWAGLLITSITGVLGGLLMWALAGPLSSDWLGIGQQWQHDAQLAFVIAACGVLPTTVTSGLRGALEGQGRFAASNLIRLVFGVLMFGLPAMALELHGPSLAWTAFYLVVARYVLCLAPIILLRTSLWCTPSWKQLQIQFAALFSFGFWLTITGLVGPLMVYGDRFFVGIAVGADQLPYYAIPQEGLLRLLIIPTALCGALLPLYATMKHVALRENYHQNLRRVAMVMLAVCTAVVLLAPSILGWWLSPEFASKAFYVIVWMAAGIWVNSLALMPYTVLHAHGRARITALFHIGQVPVYFAALYWFTSGYGLAGAAGAWFFRALLDLVLLHLAANRLMKGDLIVHR